MTEHIGTRIAYWRHRRGGMSQSALAGLAGVSQAYISQVESGHKPVERRRTLVALASALQVTVADLLGAPGDPTDPARDTITAVIPDIRAAIIECEEDDVRTPKPARAEVEALSRTIDGMRTRSEHAAMAPLVGGFLRDAHHHGGELLVRAGYEASVCLRNLGYRDLALPAARIAVRAAEDLGDLAWIGAARFVHTHAMPIEAAPTTGRIADSALELLQPQVANRDVRQMVGQLHLSASLVYAVAGRADIAADHLAAAQAEAETLGDPVDGGGFNMCCFGPTNVALWRMSVEAELGEYGKVVELARTTSPAPLAAVNRQQSYWMTLGRALAHSGKTDREALSALINAERVAPTTFALNPMARDSVVAMVYRARRRSVSADLRVMARRLGVEVAV